MTKPLQDRQVMRIARAVRKAAVAMYDEMDYGMAFNRNLAGACGDVSIVLYSFLGKANCRIVGGLFGDAQHAWNVLNNGDILDLTASQFDSGLSGVYRTGNDVRYEEDESIGKKEIREAWGDEAWRRRLKKRTERILER